MILVGRILGGTLILLAGLLAPNRPDAAVGIPKFVDLASGSDVIVIAHVDTVEGLPRGDWKASGRVLEVWKGRPRTAVAYGPAQTLGDSGLAGCDVSTAKIGETVLLFLSQDKGTYSEALRIAAGGTGRAEVYDVDGRSYIGGRVFFFPETAPVSVKRVAGAPVGVIDIEWLRAFAKSTAPPVKD